MNDDSTVLAQLQNLLVAHGVIPYYIFQCRPVSGVKNQFQVPFLRALRIVEEAKAGMNGQAKSVRYMMSHPSGKIEILGPLSKDQFLFRYHQFKYEKDASRMFTVSIKEDHTWLNENLEGVS